MVKSNCLFCSLGCDLAFKMKGDEAAAIDYLGALCPRGYYNLELINHPQRLTEPQMGQRKATWAEAVNFARQELKQFEPAKIGIVVSQNASLEEARAAACLARKLGVNNIAAGGSLADLEAFEGERWAVAGAFRATFKEVEKAETLVIVGDLLTRSPVLARSVNKVKYGQRGNKIIVLDPNDSHTAWFATDHRRIKPGTEAAALAGLIGQLDETPGVIITVPSRQTVRNDLVTYFARVLAAGVPNKKYLIMYEYGNTLGVVPVIEAEAVGHTPYRELLEKINNGQIEALLLLGDDLLGLSPELDKKVRLAKFTLLAGYFARPQAEDTVMTLPLTSHLETGGTFVLADGQSIKPEPLVPRVGGRTLVELASLLSGETIESASFDLPRLAPLSPEPESLLAAARQIAAQAEYPLANITHFGNNDLVKNFFWYRVNNG